MVRSRLKAIWLPAVIVLFFYCPGISLARESEPSPWLEIHSAHFTVVTDVGDKKGREIAYRFEQMRSVFATLLMKDRLNEPVPLTILAFKSDKTYFQSAPLREGQPISVPGFFVSGEDQNFIVLNSFEEEPWRAVAHDFAHMLLNYNYPPVEGWFDEGVAEYFSSIRVDNKQVEIGGDPELNSLYSIDLLENQKEARNPPKSLTELLGGQVWLALPDLLTMKHDTNAYNEATHHTLFYAQSWMTVHYLLHEKKLPETGTYFDLVENQHVPVEDAIQKAYGVTPAQFDQAVKDYFHSLKPLFIALDESKLANPPANAPQVYEYPSPIAPGDSTITTKSLRESDARALIAEMKVRIPERREVALQELHALETAPGPAAAKAEDEAGKKRNKNGDSGTGEEEKETDKDKVIFVAGNEIAHRALAWDHLQHGEFDPAAEELGEAAALNQRDMWIRYYLAVLKYRVAQAKHGEMQGLANMMQDLRAVLDWYPAFANAYDLLAMARKEGGSSSAAMQAERAAIQLSPRNQEYVFHLAEIYVESKKWEAARAVLERLKTSGDSQVAAQARELNARLADEQKYGITAAANAPKFTPQASPFDVLEQDAAKRAAAEKAPQAAPGAGKRSPKFFQGRLVGVDCSQAPAAVLTVISGGTALKLRTSDYKSLPIIGADEFSCAWNDRSVAVNYRPGGVGDGDLVSLELR